MTMRSQKTIIFILSCLMLPASLIATTAMAQKYVHVQVMIDADGLVKRRHFGTAFDETTPLHPEFVNMPEGIRSLFLPNNALGCKAVREVRAKAQDEKLYGLSALYDGSGFVRIPAGEFLMGSRNGNGDEQPVHRVRIRQSFEMGKFEVTQAQWESVMGSNRNAHAGPGTKEMAHGDAVAVSDPSHFKGSTLPVENVSWDDVQQFLGALNALDKKHVYRLPTEAEWEYACKAGGAGEKAESLSTAAWYRDNSKSQTQPVGQKEPNAWGLYDMHGNVWEWVQDWYSHVYYRNSPATDPPGAGPASYRVYRGGSWHSSPTDCRSAFRSFDLPVNRSYAVGFRLVKTATK